MSIKRPRDIDADHLPDYPFRASVRLALLLSLMGLQSDAFGVPSEMDAPRDEQKENFRVPPPERPRIPPEAPKPTEDDSEDDSDAESYCRENECIHT